MSDPDHGENDPAAKRAKVVLAQSHPYGFPFPPYALQLRFMDSLYKCLDEEGVGVFESPTGTGKSLSIMVLPTVGRTTPDWIVTLDRSRDVLARARLATIARGGSGG